MITTDTISSSVNIDYYLSWLLCSQSASHSTCCYALACEANMTPDGHPSGFLSGIFVTFSLAEAAWMTGTLYNWIHSYIHPSIRPSTSLSVGMYCHGRHLSSHSFSSGSVLDRLQQGWKSLVKPFFDAEMKYTKKTKHTMTRLLPLSWWGIWRPPACQPWWPHAAESAGCCLGT